MGLADLPLNRMAMNATDMPLGAVNAVFYLIFMGIAAFGSLMISVFYNRTSFSICAIIAAMFLLSLLTMGKTFVCKIQQMRND